MFIYIFRFTVRQIQIYCPSCHRRAKRRGCEVCTIGKSTDESRSAFSLPSSHYFPLFPLFARLLPSCHSCPSLNSTRIHSLLLLSRLSLQFYQYILSALPISFFFLLHYLLLKRLMRAPLPVWICTLFYCHPLFSCVYLNFYIFQDGMPMLLGLWHRQLCTRCVYECK